jgi:hypothetical protein
MNYNFKKELFQSVASCESNIGHGQTGKSSIFFTVDKIKKYLLGEKIEKKKSLIRILLAISLNVTSSENGNFSLV